MDHLSFVLGRFIEDSDPFVGIVRNERVVSLADIADVPVVETIDTLLGDWDRSFERLARSAERIDTGTVRTTELSALHVLSPITRPGRLLAAAANYRDHVAGMQRNFTNNLPKIDPAKPLPKMEPYLFAKVCPVSGPNDAILLPPGQQRIDWEAELGVVIGRPGKNIPRDRVGDHIAGYVAANDVSCRDRTWREDRPALRSDWLAGKSYDSFCPIGPFFVPKAFVPDHAALSIRLWVNGDLKQDGRSGDMIFDIEDQIGFASEMMRVEPGDVFLTGTPAGTGQERGEFLKAGDVVEIEIDLCGRQRTPVRHGSLQYRRGETV